MVRYPWSVWVRFALIRYPMVRLGQISHGQMSHGQIGSDIPDSQHVTGFHSPLSLYCANYCRLASTLCRKSESIEKRGP